MRMRWWWNTLLKLTLMMTVCWTHCLMIHTWTSLSEDVCPPPVLGILILTLLQSTICSSHHSLVLVSHSVFPPQSCSSQHPTCLASSLWESSAWHSLHSHSALPRIYIDLWWLQEATFSHLQFCSIQISYRYFEYIPLKCCSALF